MDEWVLEFARLSPHYCPICGLSLPGVDELKDSRFGTPTYRGHKAPGIYFEFLDKMCQSEEHVPSILLDLDAVGSLYQLVLFLAQDPIDAYLSGLSEFEQRLVQYMIALEDSHIP